MDPVTALGLVSSVGAIASGAVQLAQTLNLYYEKTKRAESDVRAIASEIEQSASVLEKLSKLIDGKQQESVARHYRLYSSVETSLRRCQELFDEIRIALSKVVKIVPTRGDKVEVIEFLNINRSIWPMKQQRIEILRGEMRQIRTELHLVVAVNSYEILLEDHQKRLEVEEEQLRAEDEQIIVLDLEAQAAAQRYKMLKRRRENRIAVHNPRLIKAPYKSEEKMVEIIVPRRLEQEKPERIGSFSLADMSHQQANRSAPSTEKKKRGSFAIQHTEHRPELLVIPTSRKVNCESVPDSSSDSSSHHEIDAEADSIVRIERGRNPTFDSVDIVVEASDTHSTKSLSPTNSSPVSRSSLLNGKASSTSNTTMLQDSATDPSLLDDAVESNDHTNKDKDSDPQPNETTWRRNSVNTTQIPRWRRDSINITQTPPRSPVANRRPSSPRVHDTEHTETAAQARKVDEPSVAVEEPIESINLLELGSSHNRYYPDARETWIIQANHQDASYEDRWRNATAIQSLATSETKRHHFSIQVARRKNIVQKQMALTIQQQRHILQLLEKLHKKAADFDEEGSWELEDLELEPKGKTRNDITAIKLALCWQSRWQSSEQSSDRSSERSSRKSRWTSRWKSRLGLGRRPSEVIIDMESESGDIIHKESNEEVMAVSKFNLGRWHLVSANKQEVEEYLATKETIEYPGHPKMTAKTSKSEYDAEREPRPEDFGIPGMLHRPTVWDRLRGRTGICKECVRLFKNEHFYRLTAQNQNCSRCEAQYRNKVRAYQKAYADWRDGVPAKKSIKEEQEAIIKEIRPIIKPVSQSTATGPKYTVVEPRFSNTDTNTPARGSYFDQAPRDSTKTEMSVVSYRPSERALQIMSNVTKGSQSRHSRGRSSSRERRHIDSGHNSDKERENEESSDSEGSDTDSGSSDHRPVKGW